jgi:hypothetical protein
MVIILSPAKTLDFETQHTVPRTTRPEFVEESQKLIKTLRGKSLKALRELMDISEDLARLNADRYEHWAPEHTLENSGPALLVFRGDVYQGLRAEDLTQPQLEWARDHLRILSGLYGVLKPLDLMQPYRLEMGTSLKTRRGKNLYDFWGNKIAKHLNQTLEQQGDEVLIDLASKEYSKSIDRKTLKARVISPVFQDENKGQYKVLALFAKQARGRMAGWIIENRVNDPAELVDFQEAGYRFDPEQSTETKPVFRRKEADRVKMV